MRRDEIERSTLQSVSETGSPHGGGQSAVVNTGWNIKDVNDSV